MGRLASALAGAVALARLVVDALLIARDFRRRPEAAKPVGDPLVGGPTEAVPPDGANRLGPGGPSAGPTAGQGGSAGLS